MGSRQVIDISGLSIEECHQIIFLCEAKIRSLRDAEEKKQANEVRTGQDIDVRKITQESKNRIDRARRDRENEQMLAFKESLHGTK